MAFKADWKDYVPNADGLKYKLTQNDDGTYKIEDVTTYTVVGDKLTAAQLNAIGNALNSIDLTKDAVKNVKGLVAEQTDVITGLPTGLYYYKANAPGAPNTQDGLLLALVYAQFGAHLAFPTDGGIYFRWAVDNFSKWARLDK